MVPAPTRAYRLTVLNLAAETQAYQTLLEGHRMDPDNEDLYVDLQKAKAAMELAWLQTAVAVGE
jgi:type II secretory pathway component PulM